MRSSMTGGKTIEQATADAASAATADGEYTERDDYYEYLGRRVVLVALYHETDHLQELERALVENDVFVTRAVHKMHLDMQLRQSFSELCAESSQYMRYEDKLYGPQESELGEDGMNPLKYAKTTRNAKKVLSDHIAAIANKTLSREDMLRLCKQYGCRDSGTMAELNDVMLRTLQMQMELLGFGELSQFGRDIVEKIFNKFKPLPETKGEYRPPPIGEEGGLQQNKDYDSGMLLWEFNRLLDSIGTSTMYDRQEYKTILCELEVLLDKSSNIKTEGLMNYYLNNGRLAADNNEIGIGSLDAALKGKLVFNSTYEPDAFGSLLSLVGRNNIVVDKLIQYMVYVSCVRDLKVDGEVECLSELLDMLQYMVIPSHPHILQQQQKGQQQRGAEGGHTSSAESNKAKTTHNLTEFIRILKTPGWLASNINALSEYLADGEDGIIPTMRAAALAVFGRYDRWSDEFTKDLLSKIRVEVREMEEGVAARLESELQARIERRNEEALAVAEQKRQEAAMNRGGLNKAAPIAEPPVGATEVAAEPEEVLEVESTLTIQTRRMEVINRVIYKTLPPLSENNSSDLPGELLQIKEDLIFLSELSKKQGVELSLEESNGIAERKEYFARRITRISEIMVENDQLLAAHSCALYDCIRLFGKSVSNIGAGSRDFCVRTANEGLDFIELLPPGLGEFAPVKQAYADKIERANQRKVAALAALKRERQRRNMTDEDRERLRLEQLEEQMKLWAVEEGQFYAEACAGLYAAREERKSTSQLGEMVQLWERIMATKETRYPQTLQTAVSQNNVGCVLLEFYGLDHPLGSGSVYTFQAAAEIIMTKAKAVAQRIADEKAKQLAEEEEERRLQQQLEEEAEEALRLQASDTAAEGDRHSDDGSSIQSAHPVNENTVMGDGDLDGDGDGAPGQHPLKKEMQFDHAVRQGSLDSLTVASNVMSVATNQSAASVEAKRKANENKSNPFVDVATSVLEPHEIIPSIVILANYITVLIKTESRTQLMKSFAMKQYVYDLLALLSDKERDRLDNGVIGAVKGMDVLCYMKPKDCIEPIVREIVMHFEGIRRREEAERQRILDEEEAARRALEPVVVEAPKPPTKAELRKEQKLRYAEQRRLDAIKRGETSKQRKKLYELIQTDQITAIFNARSVKATMANTPKWGSTKDMALESDDNNIGNLASSLSSKPSVAKSSKDHKLPTTAAASAVNKKPQLNRDRDNSKISGMTSVSGRSSSGFDEDDEDEDFDA